MLYETLFQPKAFLILLVVGFLSGFVFDAILLLSYFFKRNKINYQVLLFLGILTSFVIFTETNLLVNFGDVRLFAFIAFFLGFFLQRLTIGKILAKIMEKCYNSLNKFFKRISKSLRWKKKEKKESSK